MNNLAEEQRNSGKCKVMARPGAGELLGAGVDNRGGRKQTETTGHV